MEVVTCPVKVSGITQVSATASSAGFTISGASGATGFEVTYYPSNEKNLTRTVKVNSRDVVLEDLKEVYGKYTLSINPYRKAETGTSAIGASKQLSNAVGTLPGSVFGLNYSNSSTYPNTITVKWQKRYVCDGYQIMLLKEDAVTVETTWIVFNGSTQSTDIKVSECGNYYVKIRGYISFNGENHYGPWSDLVKCSTKYPGHVYNNPVETKEPTKTSEGVRTYKCAYCTSQKTETIPALNGKTENSSTDTSSTGSNAPEWSGKAEIKLSSGTVRRGRKTTIKITGSSPAKLTVKGVNSLAKNKKYVKIKNGKTAKLVFKKNAPKGKYKFKVISAAVGNYKRTAKTITIKIK